MSCGKMVMMYIVRKLINLYPMNVIFVQIIATEISRIILHVWHIIHAFSLNLFSST